MNTEQAKPKTEIELAAEKFEYLASGAPLSNVLYGYPSQKRLWWLAAQALFEQAERKKGCDKNKFYGHNFCRNCGKDLNAPGVTFDGCCWAESAIVENKPLTPCDLCRHNPPSSCDGKPCSMCPVEPKEA